MISAETMDELERQRLIECSPDRTAIRLTANGSQQMHAFPQVPLLSMNHSRTTSAPTFPRRQGRAKAAPRSLV
jgi:hypothetical protein